MPLVATLAPGKSPPGHQLAERGEDHVVVRVSWIEQLGMSHDQPCRSKQVSDSTKNQLPSPPLAAARPSPHNLAQIAASPYFRATRSDEARGGRASTPVRQPRAAVGSMAGDRSLLHHHVEEDTSHNKIRADPATRCADPTTKRCGSGLHELRFNIQGNMEEVHGEMVKEAE